MNTGLLGKFRGGSAKHSTWQPDSGSYSSMPVYFAYGSNLDGAGMARRCPQAAPIGLGTLADQRFFIMADGYASVRPEPDAIVHGLLWTVPDDDMPELDAYEEVDAGLYRKATVTIARQGGDAVAALIYVGNTLAVGSARAGYMEGVIEAASRIGLPDGYVGELRHWLPTAAR